MRVSVTILLFIGVIALMGVQVESTLLLGKIALINGKLVLIKGKVLFALLKIKHILKKLVPKEEEEEEEEYYPAPAYAPAPSYGPPPAYEEPEPTYGPPPPTYGAPAESSYSGGSSYGKKKRSIRSVEDLTSDIEIPDEESMDRILNKIYRKDNSRCIEKLVCDVATKAPENVQPEEAALLELAQTETTHGFAFRRMEAAMKAGFGGSDCEILFDSCPFGTSQMMKFITSTKASFKKAVSDD